MMKGDIDIGVAEYPPGYGEDSGSDDYVSVVQQLLQSAPWRDYFEHCKNHHQQIWGDGDKKRVIVPDSGNVSVDQCVKGSLCPAERAVKTGQQFQDAFQAHLLFRALPSASVKLPNIIMMKSIRAQTPHPPAVRSWAMPVPVLPT